MNHARLTAADTDPLPAYRPIGHRLREFRMKPRLILLSALLVAASLLAVAGKAAGGSGSNTTLDLTGIVTGFHTALDAKPAGPSPGDIGYTNGIVYEHGKRVGRFQGVCTALPQSSQQCSDRVVTARSRTRNSPSTSS
jgi:hypothetical protein